jgi:hypothetical protein
MNGRTAGKRCPRLAIALVCVAVVALLATTFKVHTQTSFATGAGPAGSAAYRQAIAFVQCMRSHGVPTLPDPPPACVPQVRVGFVTRSGTSLQVRVAGAGDGEPDAIVTRFAC